VDLILFTGPRGDEELISTHFEALPEMDGLHGPTASIPCRPWRFAGDRETVAARPSRGCSRSLRPHLARARCAAASPVGRRNSTRPPLGEPARGLDLLDHAAEDAAVIDLLRNVAAAFADFWRRALSSQPRTSCFAISSPCSDARRRVLDFAHKTDG
jgi:hypothetical protein